MASRHLDISAHQAKQVSTDLIEWADLVLTMTQCQRDSLKADYEFVEGKVFLICDYIGAGEEVSDPLQEDTPKAYEQCADQLSNLMRLVISRLKG
ncbi:MAG TPA: hypothetical protein VNL15_02405 [Dehalococcoidia bacterium]|nr:hypothetical protein [Dehalococcoidia bacterium]